MAGNGLAAERACSSRPKQLGVEFDAPLDTV